MTKRHSMAKRFSNYVDYIQSRNKKTRALYLLSLFSILIFLTIAITLPFKDQVLNRLYPKSKQQAALTDVFITPGQMNLTATFNSIGIEIFFDGDANKNAVALLEFKKRTETNWRRGIDLWGIYAATAPGPAFYGSALLLDAGTEYDVKVTITDSDGVTGTSTITGSISTRAENIPVASTLTPTHFVRADGNDANSGTSDTSSGAWKTLNKAVQSAPSGAVVQVGPGSYDALTVGRSTPITLKAQFPAIDDNQNIINVSQHSVIEPQVFSSPGQGVWQEVTLNGPHTQQPYKVWRWLDVPKWPSDIFHLSVAPSRTAQPERIAYWFPLQKNVIAGGTPNQYTLSTPEGWAEMLHVNKRYNHGFASYGNDVYLKLPGNRNPNELYVWIQPSSEKDWAPKFIFGTTDTRISGFRFTKIGPKLVSSAQRVTIDHNLFYDAGIAIEGTQPGTYGSDHVVEHNRFTASSLVDPSGSVDKGIPWDFIKGSVWTPDNQAYFNRVGQGEEFSQIFFRGGPKRMVIRHNIFEGAFNGIGVYNPSYDRYASSNIDVHENIFQNLADDALEPEFNVSNWRIWNNKINTVPVAMSAGPTNYGPMYFFRNTAWNLGASAAIRDVMGQRGIDSGLGFKYSTASSPPARLYVINNTFWSDHVNAEGGAPYAGGPNSPENFYLRNNIFRMTRYAFLPSGLTKPIWDEDYNHFYTSDPARGIASLLTISQYRNASGQGAHTNTTGDLHTSPDNWFMNAVSGDIRLSSNSPFINAGVTIPNIADNYDAKSSYIGAAPDLGAIESGGTGQPLPTASPIVPNPTPTQIIASPTATPTTSVPTPTSGGGVGGVSPSTLLTMSPGLVSIPSQGAYISTITINTQNNVTNADIALTFNPSQIEINNIDLGNYLSNPQVVQKTVDNPNGKAFFSFYSTTAKSGTGSLAYVTWKPKASGSMTLGFDPNLTIVYGTGTGNTITSNGLISATYSLNLATPTPTPTNAPTATPTQAPPTPTSTPAPVPCTLQNATWSTAAAGNGEQVTLRVTTNGSASCIGKQVSFDIHENDSLTEGGLDDNVTTNPASTTIASSTVTRTWSAEWQNDCGGFCNPNEFYFNAQIVGQSGSSIRSAEPYLTISETATPVYQTQVKLPTTVTAQSITNAQFSVSSTEGTITKTISLSPTTTAGVYTGGLPLLIDNGTYTITVKIPGYLSRSFTTTVSTGAPLNLSTLTLTAGDVDNNDVINTLDLGRTIDDYAPEGPSTSPADITKDSKVNALDLGLIIENYFKSKDSQ